MQIPLGCLQSVVSQHFLDMEQIRSVLQHVCRYSVAAHIPILLINCNRSELSIDIIRSTEQRW